MLNPTWHFDQIIQDGSSQFWSMLQHTAADCWKGWSNMKYKSLVVVAIFSGGFKNYLVVVAYFSGKPLNTENTKP